MLKHAPSGSAASQQQQQHQQQQQQQHQQKNLQTQQSQTSSHQIQHNHTHNHHHNSHVHPKHPPPPPPQLHARPNVVATTPATRAIFNRSIQPLNVSTVSHQTAPSIVLTPNKLIPNGHANGGLRIPPQTILNTTPSTSCSSPLNHCSLQYNTKHQIGAREALTSLGLLCLGMHSDKRTVN